MANTHTKKRYYKYTTYIIKDVPVDMMMIGVDEAWTKTVI